MSGDETSVKPEPTAAPVPTRKRVRKAVPKKPSKPAAKFDPAKPLLNARHEKFAQALVGGKSAIDAFVAAGFKANRGNAARLNANECVRARVEMLKGKAATKVVVTREWVLDKLQENALGAMNEGQRAAAAQSLKLLGQEVASMFVDRHDVRIQAGVEAVLELARPHCEPRAYAEFLRALAIASGAEGVAVSDVLAEGTTGGDEADASVH